MNVLRRAWHRWQLIAQVNGDFIARLTVVVFYYIIFAPFAIGARVFADPLGLKHLAAWAERKPVGASLEDARGQS
ncbi:MAG: hypothetical protein ACYDBJ_08295 [Aggregatilineales bacterium]